MIDVNFKNRARKSNSIMETSCKKSVARKISKFVKNRKSTPTCEILTKSNFITEFFENS